ncbi:ribose 5-phosphate isomerase A [soil metagenome]
MSDAEKIAAARHAAGFVRDGMLVGLGTGSTAAHMVARLGERITEEKLNIHAVCTSKDTERLAKEHGIKLLPLTDKQVDLCIDGADQVNGRGDMIKGGGGALLREKMVAMQSRRRIYIVDSGKTVMVLAKGFPVPVEIIQFGFEATLARLRRVSGCTPMLRVKGSKPFVTDEGHYIADCAFERGIKNPAQVDYAISEIVGVVTTGLFIGLCDMLVIGKGGGVEVKEFGKDTEDLQ